MPYPLGTMPNTIGLGHETSPPPLAGAPGLHDPGAITAAPLFPATTTTETHLCTLLQRSLSGGVCCLCPPPITGENHG